MNGWHCRSMASSKNSFSSRHRRATYRWRNRPAQVAGWKSAQLIVSRCADRQRGSLVDQPIASRHCNGGSGEQQRGDRRGDHLVVFRIAAQRHHRGVARCLRLGSGEMSSAKRSRRRSILGLGLDGDGRSRSSSASRSTPPVTAPRRRTPTRSRPLGGTCKSLVERQGDLRTAAIGQSDCCGLVIHRLPLLLECTAAYGKERSTCLRMMLPWVFTSPCLGDRCHAGSSHS